MSVDALEKERDFYYGKLRSIEIMCTDKEGEDEMGLLVGQIFEVLYATEDGFQVGQTNVRSKIFWTDQRTIAPIFKCVGRLVGRSVGHPNV